MLDFLILNTVLSERSFVSIVGVDFLLTKKQFVIETREANVRNVKYDWL